MLALCAPAPGATHEQVPGQIFQGTLHLFTIWGNDNLSGIFFGKKELNNNIDEG